MRVLLFILFTLGMTSLAHAGKFRDASVPLETIPEVQIDRYLGLWYEIARYPNWFERNCTGVTAHYSMLPNGNIRVENTCFKGDLTGRKTVAKGEAWQVGPAKLKVSFVPVPLIKNIASGDYWVIYLDEDYTTAVVGDPKGNFGWILSRTPQITQRAFDKALDALKQAGYNADLLEYVKQK